MKTDILIAGVGGQGILLISGIIGKAAVKQNFKVIGTETHGMSQRGGSVVSHVRIGDVFSPLISKGGADFLIAFEPIEALRSIDFLKEKGLAIVNTVPFPPKTSSIKYPKVEAVFENLFEFSQVVLIDAVKIAKSVGNPLTANMALLGAASAAKEFPLNETSLKEVIKESVPEKTVETNLKTFDIGRKEAKVQLYGE